MQFCILLDFLAIDSSSESLRKLLSDVISGKEAQGHVTDGLELELRDLPASVDAMHEFAQRLADLPLRANWTYVEPTDLDSIWMECGPSRPLGAIR